MIYLLIILLILVFLLSILQMRLMKKNRKLTMENNQIKKGNEESSHMCDSIVSQVDREVAGPLSILQGHLQIVGAERNLPFSVHKNLEMAISTSERIDHFLSNMITLKQYRTASFQPENEPVNLSTMITRICRDYRQSALHRGITLNHEIDISLYHTFLTDFSILEKCFTALLENSVLYTVEGEVRVRAERVDDITKIYIKDTGIGMIENLREELFDSPIKNTNFLNTAGLGIPLARKGFSLLGGTISCEAEPEKGTMIEISLPLPVEELEHSFLNEPKRTHTILCINITESAQNRLKDHGHTIHHLPEHSDEKTSHFIKRENIDFVVIRVKDCSRIKRKDFPEESIVILLVEGGSLSKCEGQGFSTVLPSSISNDDLLWWVDNCLKEDYMKSDDKETISYDPYLDTMVKERDIASLINDLAVGVLIGDLRDCEAITIRLTKLLDSQNECAQILHSLGQYDFQESKRIVNQLALKNSVVLLGGRYV